MNKFEFNNVALVIIMTKRAQYTIELIIKGWTGVVVRQPKSKDMGSLFLGTTIEVVHFYFFTHSDKPFSLQDT